MLKSQFLFPERKLLKFYELHFFGQCWYFWWHYQENILIVIVLKCSLAVWYLCKASYLQDFGGEILIRGCQTSPPFMEVFIKKYTMSNRNQIKYFSFILDITSAIRGFTVIRVCPISAPFTSVLFGVKLKTPKEFDKGA